MSSDFSYLAPDAAKYMKAILFQLKKKGHEELYKLLKRAQCSIIESSSYSRRRWNALWTTVTFTLPMDDYEQHDFNDEEREILTKICDSVMPTETGFDVMGVECSPSLDSIDEPKTLDNDLDEITDTLQDISASFNLPEDITEKGRQMAEVYSYLYVVENYLRLFIQKVSTQMLGDEYFKKLTIPVAIQNTVISRKKQEEKNQWISIRGDSDLFYLDFKDLSAIIRVNWDIFKAYFPDMAWITSKIDELGDCRNLVAHNSFIGDHERDVIRVNFRSIVKQINPIMK